MSYTSSASTIAAPSPGQPLTLNNLMANNSLYQSVSVSSTDSLDTVTSVSTIKLASPSPKPTFPNYYQPLTKEQIAAMKNLTLLNKNNSSQLLIFSDRERPHKAPALVRKKSGELVKSSLKLPGLLTKSLLTSQLHQRLKSVRFASRLANIKMFDGTESPSTVSTNDNTPIHSPQSNDFLDDDEQFAYLHNPQKRNDYFHWNWNGDFLNGELTSDTSSDEDDEWTAHRPTVSKHREYRLVSHNIPMTQPLLKNVYLKSVNLLKDDNGYLFGLINVKNLAFEKNLTLKLTMNKWETSVMMGSSVISYNRPLPNNYDQFKFRIPLTDLLKGKPDLLEIQLCIKYDVHNDVYWDNNNNNNYQMTLKAILGIKTYNYKKDEEDFPQFNELITKLIKFQSTTSADASKKHSIHSRYNNLNDELEQASKPRSISVAPVAPKNRPPLLKHSFSSSDINDNTPPHKYSQSYKSKHQAAGQKADFSSLSYADLINNYCFSNGAESNASKKISSVKPDVLTSCSPSAASTFHALSDSIHI